MMIQADFVNRVDEFLALDDFVSTRLVALLVGVFLLVHCGRFFFYV
jgi:hypothetical protein